MTWAAAKEDIWALALFPPEYMGFACEVGAADGIQLSNTLLLEREGWDVLSIEANPNYGPSLLANRKCHLSCACDAEPKPNVEFHINEANAMAMSSLRPIKDHSASAGIPQDWHSVYVPVLTLNQCLELVSYPRLDVLSIDTEGTEIDVLRGLDLQRWKPRAIIVETWDDDGKSSAYLNPRGYERQERRQYNDLFLRVEF